MSNESASLPQPRRFNRRKFFLGGAAAGAVLTAAYAGGWWWFKARDGNTEDLIVSILRRHLREYQTNEEDFRDFAQAMQPHYIQHTKLAMLGMFGPVYERVDVFAWLPQTRITFRHLENHIVQEFLLSTDFFQDGVDASKPINYYGARNADRRICGNPFANFDPE